MNNDRYQTLARIAFSNAKHLKDDLLALKFMTGLIAEGLHRMRFIHTGLVSEAASVRGVKICKEHFFGRQRSAEIIMDQIAKGKSFERIVALIKSRSRVHYTTAKENMRLREYSDIHWKKAYELAGIKLIPFERRGNKYVYKVEGICYNSLSDIADAYNLDEKIVKRNCTSLAKKWKEWNRERIN